MKNRLKRITELVSLIDLKAIDPSTAAIIEQIRFHAEQALKEYEELNTKPHGFVWIPD